MIRVEAGISLVRQRLADRELRRVHRRPQARQQALDLFRTVGDRLGKANVLLSTAKLHLGASDSEELKIGARNLDTALELSRQCGDRSGQVNCLIIRAIWLVNHQETKQALAFAQQGLEMGRSIDPDHPVTRNIENLVNQIRDMLDRER